MKIIYGGLAAALSLPLLLTGCATAGNGEVPSIIKDKRAYLDKNFGVQSLSAAQRAQLEEGGAVNLPLKGTVTITLAVVYVDSSKNQTRNQTEIFTLRNGGDGMLSIYREDENNDVPYAASVAEDFLGLVTYKTATIYYANNRVTAPAFVQKITKLDKDAAKPAENAEYDFSYGWGGANYDQKCRSGTFYPASTLSPKLTGNAVDLECINYRNEIQTGRTKYIFLSQYGIYMPVHSATSASEATGKITEISEE